MSIRKRFAGAAASIMLGAAVTVTGIPPVAVFAQEAADLLLQEQRLNTWYSQAIESINAEDYENAMLCLDGCMLYCTESSNPTLYADLYMKRGYCCLMLQQYDDALEALEEALETDPEMENAILLKASVYSETGKYPEAIEMLEKYSQVSEDYSVYETVAALYEAEGNTEKAFESYQTFAQKAAGSEADAAALCGVYKMQRGEYEEAVKWFDQSLEAEEPADNVYYNRGLCRMSLGDYETAIADFGSSVEKEESGADDALYTKATCEMTILNYEAAVADFTACIEREANPEDSRINKGFCLLLSGKEQEALKDFNYCIEEGIKTDEARFYRSFVYLSTKEYESALSDLTSCIDNGYEPASSYLQRAQVYKQMGNEEAYRADLEAAKQAQTAEAAKQAQTAETEEESVEDMTEG